MGDDLVKVGDQFGGLDMASLIGGPLRAACDAQTMLASSTTSFIRDIGMDYDENSKKYRVRTTSFSFTRAKGDAADGEGGTEKVEMNVPLLSMVNVPNLQVDDVNVTFDMEVKSAVATESKKDKEGSLDANAGLKVGPFHMDVKIKGSISSHESNTRSSDNSAKYHVEVHAKQAEAPEGLSRMLDVLATACTPVAVEDSGSAQPAREQ